MKAGRDARSSSIMIKMIQACSDANLALGVFYVVK